MSSLRLALKQSLEEANPSIRHDQQKRSGGSSSNSSNKAKKSQQEGSSSSAKKRKRQRQQHQEEDVEDDDDSTSLSNSHGTKISNDEILMRRRKKKKKKDKQVNAAGAAASTQNDGSKLRLLNSGTASTGMDGAVVKRGRGRPKGSTNKKKRDIPVFDNSDFVTSNTGTSISAHSSTQQGRNVDGQKIDNHTKLLLHQKIQNQQPLKLQTSSSKQEPDYDKAVTPYLTNKIKDRTKDRTKDNDKKQKKKKKKKKEKKLIEQTTREAMDMKQKKKLNKHLSKDKVKGKRDKHSKMHHHELQHNITVNNSTAIAATSAATATATATATAGGPMSSTETGTSIMTSYINNNNIGNSNNMNKNENNNKPQLKQVEIHATKSESSTGKKRLKLTVKKKHPISSTSPTSPTSPKSKIMTMNTSTTISSAGSTSSKSIHNAGTNTNTANQQHLLMSSNVHVSNNKNNDKNDKHYLESSDNSSSSTGSSSSDSLSTSSGSGSSSTSSPDSSTSSESSSTDSSTTTSSESGSSSDSSSSDDDDIVDNKSDDDTSVDSSPNSTAASSSSTSSSSSNSKLRRLEIKHPNTSLIDNDNMDGVFDSERSSDDENDDIHVAKKRKITTPSSQSSLSRHSHSSSKGKASNNDKHTRNHDDEMIHSKKKKGKQKSVIPPTKEVIAWIMCMSQSKQQSEIKVGMRVKVRFSKPTIKWYGGMVTQVFSNGSKVRILYDDGTKETCNFPDKEIVVDDVGNGCHDVSADAFKPTELLFGKSIPITVPSSKKLEKEDNEEEKEGMNHLSSMTIIPTTTTSSSPPFLRKEKENRKKDESLSEMTNEKNDELSLKEMKPMIEQHVKTDVVEKLRLLSSDAQCSGDGKMSNVTTPDSKVVESSSSPPQSSSVINEKKIDNHQEHKPTSEHTRTTTVTKKDEDAVPKNDSQISLNNITTSEEVKNDKVAEASSTMNVPATIEEETKVESDSQKVVHNSSTQDDINANKDTPMDVDDTFNSNKADESAVNEQLLKNEKVSKDKPEVIKSVTDTLTIGEDKKEERSKAEKNNKRDQSNDNVDKSEVNSSEAMPKNKKPNKRGSGKVEQQESDAWVKCDKCMKWRLVPSLENLPEKWYCEMNVTDLERNSCDAPEQQTQQEVTKRRRKNKKKGSLMISKSSDSLDGKGSMKSANDDDDSNNNNSSNNSNSNNNIKQGGEENDINEDVNIKPKPAKRGRQPKEIDNKVESKGKKKGRKPKEIKQEEWVQCDKCKKWRLLPPSISSKDLPDTWYCNMNTWDPRSASCAVQDESKAVEDANVREGILSGAQKSSSSRLTYRDMISTKEKPMSERVRASQSLFSSHAGDHEGESLGPVKVNYFNSSAFQCRVGLNRMNSVENTSDKRLGLFDLMSHSHLWKNLSCRLRVEPRPNVEESVSIAMQAMVHFALGNGNGPMTADEVLLECQIGDWDGMPWTDLRSKCTIDSIVGCLRQLEEEGLIEKVGSSVNTLLIRYRQVVIEGLGDTALPFRRSAASNDDMVESKSITRPLKKRALLSS